MRSLRKRVEAVRIRVAELEQQLGQPASTYAVHCWLQLHRGLSYQQANLAIATATRLGCVVEPETGLLATPKGGRR